ncbi:MAG: FlgO family outer membrane protein [Vicinamibacterales bacterium]
MLDRLGPYRVTASLGEGGMGVVYAAVDERLQRSVALKVIHAGAADDDTARERFRREARLAASVNHPGVCHLYEIGEADGQLFIAMELLEGESLAARLRRGPLALDTAVDVTLGVLDAAEVLHHRGIVHRDLKPSNIFLTARGIKVLDFGIARVAQQDLDTTRATLTAGGTVIGTFKYMAPEQLRGAPADGRADLFAIGVILYEMLLGRPPFEGETLAALAEQILHRDSAVLGGSPAVAAVDRVIHRALAKDAGDRYATATDMAADLRAAAKSPLGLASSVPARAVTRLVVLPFRLLRPDAEFDFLGQSFADAITNSLSTLQSLVLRPTLVAARLAAESHDLKAIAQEADVDLVVTGTLLRANDQLRVSAQLIAAAAGTVLWTHTVQTSLGDVFQVQDELVRRIVDSMAAPLSGREQRAAGRDVPASAKAYEFYLRANALGHEIGTWPVARGLYLQCVQDDPSFAPAWARLGRVYRLIGKFQFSPDHLTLAESAFNRALVLNPELAMADNYYAQLELDLGRADEAMVRLLRRAAVRSSGPDLFVALVSAGRYCGLLQPSVAAHERARRLDPKVRTSVQHTHFMAGDYLRAADVSERRWEAGNMGGLALACAGHPDAERLMRAEAARYEEAAAEWVGMVPLIERDYPVLRAAVDKVVTTFPDPEAHFYNLLMLSRLDDWDRSIEILAGVVDRGFFPYETFARHPWLDAARDRPDFQAVLARAQRRNDQARAEYVKAGGEALLGPID